ncbi:MAG: DNA replication and repair protein RecF, partial [[Clostridium] fimetarium]|nr:DNA replication and repair protein RecF [[Clostridium] fimetarium]
MQIKTLAATNFKNIADARLEFSSKANCFLGDNGMGKSNLLDAVYYLSFCKSFSGLADSSVVRLGEEFMTLRGTYERRGADEEVTIGLQPGRRKSVRRGGKEYERLSAHIGVFPLVMVSPSDQDLVSGSGEERRRFMDQVISQADAVYLDHLIRYDRALTQRNKMLRDRVVDHHLYEAVELALARSASYITRARSKWVGELTEIFRPIYAAIAADGETPALELKGHLAADAEALPELLDQCRRHDEAVGHTSVGPHR